MIKSFIEYFRSYYKEVMIPYRNWIGKHKIGYYVVAPIICIGVTFLYLLYLARKDKKALESNDYEEEES